MTMIERRLTRKVWIGNEPVGGDAPVMVQSMCDTDTKDVEATVAQIHALEEAGCEVIRVAAPTKEAAQAIGRIAPAEIAAVRAEILALSDARDYEREAHWRVDARLHNLFIDACGNPVLTQMVRALRATTHLFEIARLRDRLQPDNREHVAILDALEAGDAKAVRKAAQVHLRSLHAFALTVVS